MFDFKLITMMIGLAFSPVSFAAESADSMDVRPLDGVIIEAVDNYKNSSGNEVSFGVGIFPFNTYYNGFSVNLGYATHFNKRWAWEVLNAHFVSTVNTDVTSQLADEYGVEPEEIEKIEFLGSTNLFYTFAYGKYVFVEKYIHYFRSSYIFGLGAIGTNKVTNPTVNLGWNFEIFISSAFSLNFEIRDNISVGDKTENNVYFNIGTGLTY